MADVTPTANNCAQVHQNHQAEDHVADLAHYVNTLLVAVREALFLGSSVACPHCGIRGEKNGACMHITCGNRECRRPWCYCCGRTREVGVPHRCQGCDRQAVYIENFPGWGDLQREQGETQGYAALHEFHRRRVAYFLRCLKEAVPHAPWQEFWRRHFVLLQEVPTPHRSISQVDIETAEPPTFSGTPAYYVAWINEMDPIISRLQMEFAEECPEPSNRAHLARSARRQGRRIHTPHSTGGGTGTSTQELILAAVLMDETMDDDLRLALIHNLLDSTPS